MSRSPITYERLHRGFEINNDHGGCFVSTLERLIDLVTYMNINYSRVFAFRFDIRFPQMFPVPQANCIEEFLRRFAQHFRRKGVAIEYLWCREQPVPDCHHYAVVFLVDGTEFYSVHEFYAKAELEWNRFLQGSFPARIHHCRRTNVDGEKSGCFRRPLEGIMIEGGRGSEYRQWMLTKAVFWFSYACKVHTKGLIPPKIRMWDSSRPWVQRKNPVRLGSGKRSTVTC